MAGDDLGTSAPVYAGDGERAIAPLGWLLGMLQEAMTEVMEGDSGPLQKANAVARLGNLYLKAYQTNALQQENRELTRKVDDLEQRLAALSAATERAPVTLKSAASRPKPQKLSRSRTLPPRG